MALDVVGLGYPVMDCLIRVEQLPGPGGVTALQEYSWQGGGMVATALVAASVLGARCGIIGAVGGDKEGRFCAMDLERNGVDVSHLKICPQAHTDFSFVLSESALSERRFISSSGGSGRLDLGDLDEAYIAQAKYLFVCQMDDLGCAAARIARQNGVKVFIDADMYHPEIAQHLDLIDVLVGSESFYEGMFSDRDYRKNCAELAFRGPEIALITLGARGVAGAFRSEYLQLPACEGLDVVDTTGAGDVFHGAFLYALLKNWPGEACARFACAAAGIKCTRLGGRAGIADARTVAEFLQTGRIDYAGIDRRVAMYQGGFHVV